jgi:hypothetical protein
MIMLETSSGRMYFPGHGCLIKGELIRTAFAKNITHLVLKIYRGIEVWDLGVNGFTDYLIFASM